MSGTGLYRKSPHCHSSSTHVALRRALLKRRPMIAGVVVSVWLCNKHLDLSGEVEVSHPTPSPRTKRTRENLKNALQLMSCPICHEPMKFLGWLPPPEYLRPAE